MSSDPRVTVVQLTNQATADTGDSSSSMYDGSGRGGRRSDGGRSNGGYDRGSFAVGVRRKKDRSTSFLSPQFPDAAGFRL